MFLQKKTSHYRDSSVIFLATNFTRKMPESSDSTYSSIFMLENKWSCNFTSCRRNFQEIVNFVLIMGYRGPELNWNKIHNFVWILSTSGKLIYFLAWHRGIRRIWAFWHFLSRTGCQKYSIWVQKRTRFMHMRVNNNHN